MTPKRIFGVLALLAACAILPACEALVTFDPVDFGPKDDGGESTEGDVDVDGDVPDRPDVVDDGPGPDGDADGDGDGEADGDDGDVGDEGGPICGNGVTESGEECDLDPPEGCTTLCGDGTRRCVDCHWAACETATAETCNDVDDDCDTLTDEDFDCRAGQPTDCTTSCGSTGRTLCSAACTIETCPPPVETCNGLDDDCDDVTDNGYPCRQGMPVSCTTSCGTSGSGFCTSTCTVPPAAECAPPPETCNGVDDNCNGLTDEGLWSPSSTEVRLTTTVERSIRPSLVWKADTAQYGLAYEEEATVGEGGSVFFALLDEAGARDLATDATIAAAAGATRHEHPSLAWSAPQWGIVWSQNDGVQSDLRFRWASANGGTLGTSLAVAAGANRSDEPVLAWIGAEYGIVWNDSRDTNLEVYFTRLTTSGTLPGGYAPERVSTTSTCASSRPTMAWMGTEYGLAWYEWCAGDPGDIYFARVSAAGRVVAGSTRGVVTGTGAQDEPKLAWNGTEYGMVWLDDNVGCYEQLRFERLNTDGVPFGALVALTTCADTPGVDSVLSLAWDAGRREWAVAWSDQRNSAEMCGAATCGTEIYFARLTQAGGMIGAPVRVTTAPGATNWPVLADNGDGFAIAWSDERNGNPEIYFNTLSCR
jgi:hypothetical protein